MVQSVKAAAEGLRAKLSAKDPRGSALRGGGAYLSGGF